MSVAETCIRRPIMTSLLSIAAVVAGAIAFSAWEPLAYMMLSGAAGGYAKGVVLLGTFIVSLLVLRMVADRLVPQDLPMPKAANLAIGAIFGAGSADATFADATAPGRSTPMSGMRHSEPIFSFAASAETVLL